MRCCGQEGRIDGSSLNFLIFKELSSLRSFFFVEGRNRRVETLFGLGLVS